MSCWRRHPFIYGWGFLMITTHRFRRDWWGMGNQTNARGRYAKIPLLNLKEWKEKEKDYKEWVRWSVLNVEQRWGIMNKSPGWLGWVRAGALGSTATYRIINIGDDRTSELPQKSRRKLCDKALSNPCNPNSLSRLGVCNSRSLIATIRGEISTDASTNEYFTHRSHG